MKKILRFTASWCGPCKTMAKQLESVNINLSEEMIKEINEVQTIYPNPCP